MKKHLIIFLFLSFFIYWCGQQNTVFVEFEEASKIFSQQIKDFNSKINKKNSTWYQNMDFFLQANWENKDFKLQSSFYTSWNISLESFEYDLLTSFYSYFYDKKEQKENTFSWNIYNKFNNNYLYFNIKDVFIDIWKWNYQWDLVSLIAKNLENKRISIKSKNNTIQKIKDINFILNTLSGSENFDLLEKVTYESHLAYKIQIKQDVLSHINWNIQNQISWFRWLLVVKSISDVELKIEFLDFIWENNTTISGLISKDDWFLIIKDKTIPTKDYSFFRKTLKRHTSFVLSQNQNYQQLLKLNIDVYSKNNGSIFTNYIEWNLTISPLIIYWSDLEKEIEININGEQSFNEIPNGDISEPDSYIFLDQILWDSFSLENLLKQSDFLGIKN